MPSPHARALLQALFVTLIWSLSWVLIKLGLTSIAPITFAGLRYVLAFLCLLALSLNTPAVRAQIRSFSRREWGLLALFGLIYYTVTQATQFMALEHLPSVTLSLLLSFTPGIVAILGAFLLAERPTAVQWLGIGIFLIGVIIYFYPIALPEQQIIGLIIGVTGALANALSSILGRFINRDLRRIPLAVTTVSMGIGSIVMLAIGLIVEGWPQLGVETWALIIWLAVVHTAFAFTLWNRTQRVLTAVESSLINNTMLIQIAVLAWIFLGETITGQEILGLGVAVVGVIVVQFGRVWIAKLRTAKT